MRSTWSAGDYPLMATRLEPVSAVAVDIAGVAAHDAVIDVATGTGNAALFAAARGARVIAIDTDTALLDIARSRATRSQAVEWLEGDATRLPVSDGWADVVCSVFGVMYAADHNAAARELARVAAPGGRVILASWTPDSLMPEFGRAIAPFLPPPPPATGPPTRWGDADSLRALLDEAGIMMVDARTATVSLRFDDAAAATSFLIHTAGHVVTERERLERAGLWPDLVTAVEELVDRRNSSAPGVQLDAEYLLVRGAA